MKGVNDQISSSSTKRPSRPAPSPSSGIEGQGQVLVVVDRRPRQHHPAQHGPSRPQQQAQQNHRLEGDVGGQKVGHRDPHPHAQRERHQEERQQGQGLPPTAVLGKEKPPEGGYPRQHAGHRGHHAQLDQQRDQNEIVRHPINVSRQAEIRYQRSPRVKWNYGI